ncbi:hypothetical protein [Mariniblastus fucicola]|uniref:Core-binding (CB) domain-containing protein n=1 Tax=Mariniblastus fucicola TaxID=980251 RepID=A0A5B9PES6_9BACT|nr:hypothetical protein [Mariniblastus fucicola]QEG24764.1 hypothetical protein MFFC18_46870 [Mariniblastus fucicola]
MVKSSEFRPASKSKSVSRTRKKWRADARGYFSRQIGWELSRTGKLQQHKFLLGKERRQAEWRERKLRELWDRFANSTPEDKPLWPEDLLEIAKLIAKGVEEVAVVSRPDDEAITYASRIQALQAEHSVVLFVPADRYLYDVGCAALHCLGKLPALETRDRIQLSQNSPGEYSASNRKPPKRKIGNVVAPNDVDPSMHDRHLMSEVPQFNQDIHAILATMAAQGLIQLPDANVSLPKQQGYQAPAPSAQHDVRDRSTFYDAIEAYQKYIRREYYRPELDRLTSWGHTQIKQMNTLKQHLKNRLLSKMDADGVNEMIGYWRRRPTKKGSSDPMTAKSASNYISALVRFLKWLHTSSEFSWTKPFAFSDANTRVQRLASDHANRKLEQVDTFSLDELKLLMRYSLPLDRLLLLLGLNCGFGRAEISTLLVKECRLFEAHTPRQCELINYQSTDEESFIKRIRRKSGVYGEHVLFPMTVQGIQWAIEQRNLLPKYSDDARLLLNTNGKPFDHPTKSGNTNQTIPNRLARTIKRIQNDGHEIRNLSFGKLRKTAGQLIKTFSSGEIMGVFECHGRPVKSDELNDLYSNRPFGKVFEAIKEVESYLEPVFAEAGKFPFVE